MTSPIRYHQAMSATAPAPRFSVLCSVRSGPTLAAMVISRPSRIQAIPSATTSLVKNRDQGSRSILAGIRLRIFGLSGCWFGGLSCHSRPPGIPRPELLPLPITHPFAFVTHMFRALQPRLPARFRNMHVASLLAWGNRVSIVSSVNDVSAADAGALAGAEAAKAEAAELLAAVGAVRRVAAARCAAGGGGWGCSGWPPAARLGVAEAAQELRFDTNSVHQPRLPVRFRNMHVASALGVGQSSPYS